MYCMELHVCLSTCDSWPHMCMCETRAAGAVLEHAHFRWVRRYCTMNSVGDHILFSSFRLLFLLLLLLLFIIVMYITL